MTDSGQQTPAAEPLEVLACPDPVAAFFEAHRTDRLLALRTSGTTSTPRVIVRTTASWVDSLPRVSELTGIDATSRVWVPGPVTATMNLFAAVHAHWAGAELSAEPDGATHAHVTPSTLARLLAQEPASLHGLHVITAGDRLTRSTHRDAVAAGVTVSHYYGAAELSFVAWGEHADALRPFPGVEIEARDGELWVRSPYLCLGYLDPAHRLHRDAAGWVSVGDRGTAGPEGVHVHGRDGAITTAGATVRISDIEAVLHPEATGEVVVLGLDHAELGQVVAAAVTRQQDVAHLQQVSRQVLTAAQQPRRWVHLARLPLTAGGKIDRAAVAVEVARSLS
ncbi:AMP-binding protein [Nocardioides dubius]|uniref:AMP-dependent synthetase/ligase domain-containing protein n=1 Tax=Nocardioides dubius TaxID=317019 RepID=A0ABP4EL77_9ACTN